MAKYDVIIIGGGPAGMVASKILVAFGKKVAIVEAKKIGGDCTHTGCVPSKTLLKSAKAYHDAKNLVQYGLKSNELEIDTSNVMKHVRSVVAEIYDHETPEEFAKFNITVIEGFAKFKNANEIEVNGKTYFADKYILATGSSPLIPKIDGLKEIDYLTNETIFNLDEIPKSMIIIGTGAIGVEMATAFNRLGCKVFLLSRNEGILKQNDEEMSNILLQTMIDEGVVFVPHVEPKEIQKIDGGIKLCLKQGCIDEVITAERILIATGRSPNVNLDLNKAGVEYDKRGVKVDEYLQTSASHIYAMGDIATKYKFTHIAEQEAIVAASNVGLPIKKKINYDGLGWCVYSEPEFAQIGLTPKEAFTKYSTKVSTYKFEYKSSDRGYTDVDKIGMIKISVLANGKIVGASILGSRAGELIHQLQLAKTFGISFDKLSKMVYIYPTYADIIKQPAKQFYIAKLMNNPVLKILKTLKGLFSKG